MDFLYFYFTDIVVGQPVNVYKDYFGLEWMANDRWGWFRVRKS